MNQAILTGYLVKDIELRKTQQNKSVASFTIAVSNGKDKNADFINCVAVVNERIITDTITVN